MHATYMPMQKLCVFEEMEDQTLFYIEQFIDKKLTTQRKRITPLLRSYAQGL